MGERAKKGDPIRVPGVAQSDFFAGLVKVGRQLGFDYCSYATKLPTTEGRVAVICDNYPASWWSRHREMAYPNIDPGVGAATGSDAPVLWPDGESAVANSIAEDAMANGLGAGWMKSVRDVQGVVGVLTLARERDPITAEELEAKSAMMVWLAHVAHEGLYRLLAREYASAAPLSARELEVLRWSAEGKTAGEIALILGIAERTVVFHVNRVVDKLGVSTKIHAVARAVRLGLV